MSVTITEREKQAKSQEKPGHKKINNNIHPPVSELSMVRENRWRSVDSSYSFHTMSPVLSISWDLILGGMRNRPFLSSSIQVEDYGRETMDDDFKSSCY